MVVEQQKNIVRFTLQSYVGPSINHIEITQRQKDAIQRLIYLPDQNFVELCDDIVNEIHRRNGMKHTTTNAMFNKLVNLSDEKFKNLVVDTLLVYNYRNPGNEYANDDFLNNLKKLIEDLKATPENDNFIEEIKNLAFVNKISEYNKYVRRNSDITKEIIELIDSEIKKELEMRAQDLLECLTYPNIFLEKVDKSNIADTEEYKFHRNNIQKLLENNKTDSYDDISDKFESQALSALTKSKLIKSEMMQIFSILINRISLPAKNIEPFHDEIVMILDTLKSIKNDLEGGEKIDLKDVSFSVNTVVDGLLSKTLQISQDDNEVINDLKMQKILIGELQLSATKMDAIQLILDLAKSLQKIIIRVK